MSKNIIIQENGVAQSLSNVEKIKTNVQGGGTVDWVAEDDVALSPLTITANGTYTPGAGVYGFDTVTVDVKIVTGKIDGATYEVTLDANGYLVYTEVET